MANPPATVDKVDIQKYSGKWYEIASIPVKQQKNCSCTTAEYIISDKKYIEVYNKCIDKNSNKLKGAKAKAFPVKGSNNSKLKVQFFWPFKGDYWILKLSTDYSYAVVGTPDRKHVWILSRKPIMDESLYKELVSFINDLGFDINKINKTSQNCVS